MNIMDRQLARRYERDGARSYLLVGADAVGARQHTVSWVELAPGGRQRPHAHETEQSYFILAGHGRMTVGPDVCDIGPGQAVFIPSNAEHSLENTTAEPLQYLAAGAPPFGADQETQLWPLPPESE